MYLKALEIQGFKSFPDKVRLSFEKNMTAIVGPNGSGKSNISDAICWVMGEQSSKTLRGQKMEDVIFGGSGQRSASGFAQVSLILDNSKGIFRCDSDEVAITRRYYRSGESGYFINKRSVRLKDINELLMDTGLGRDGYSIIGQGRVDEILSAKSTDRREIFEEAAGISKYRYRKEETRRKLDKTEENLLRVGDKISELELQVEPLRKQAEVAKKYLILRDELRDLEISVWMDSLDKLREKSAQLDSEYSTAGDELEQSKAELELLYASSEEFSENMRAADMRAETVRSGISVCEALAAATESEAAVLAADIKNNEAAIERLSEEIEGGREREAQLRGKLAAEKARLDEITAETGLILREKQEMFEMNETAREQAGEAGRQLDVLLAEAVAAESAAAAEKARRGAMEQAAEELRLRRDSAASDKQSMALREKEELSRLEQARMRQDAAREAEQEAANALEGFKMRAGSRKNRAAELSEKLRQLKLDESAAKSRISLLTEMEKEYEGFSRAVRTVMRESARGMLKNVHGTVSQLIKTEDRYTAAIETALDHALQNVVVSSEEDGKAAVNMLKRMDAGRATFLPLSAMRGTELNERGVEDEYGVEGIASRLVRYDEKYRGVVQYLLGRTVITEDMDTAIALARKYSRRFRIVTLDGQVLNAGGAMTGGSAARNVGILSRKNELEGLKKKAEKLAAAIREAENSLAAAERELAEAEFQAEKAALQLRQAQDELLALKAETGQREVLVSSVRESMEAHVRTFAELEKAIEANAAAVVRSAEETKRQEQIMRSKQAEAEKLGAGHRQLQQRLDELGEKLAVIREKETALSAERESLEGSSRQWTRLLESFDTERGAKAEERERLKALSAELVREESIKRAEVQEQRMLITEKRQELDAVIAEKLKYEAMRTKTDRSAQDKNRDINELERRFADAGARKTAAEMEEKQLVDKLWDTYELSRTAAQRIRSRLDSIPRATKRIGEIRREMSRMGNPNIGAIEEFERVNERYTFLTEQRDDIEKAKKELIDIVNDITEEMEKIFAREFKAIAGSFSDTFVELFGGGHAELRLEDEEDILNCGIEIRVQPPGKSMRSLTLLSGGERAFVAIALYFAIFKVRPTPFCVVDEIETALDESNVSRFAQYLRRMSGSTQFLIITHRRGTMEEADMLYGVTMQKGVSRVIGVDLQEALKTS